MFFKTHIHTNNDDDDNVNGKQSEPVFSFIYLASLFVRETKKIFMIIFFHGKFVIKCTAEPLQFLACFFPHSN